MKNAYKNIFLVIFSVLIFFAALEIVLRATEPTTKVMCIYEKDDENGFSLKKNYSTVYKTEEYEIDISINSAGQRDREYPQIPNKSILFLGDSYVFGQGVNLNETMSKFLELYAGNASGTVVINGGVPSYSSIQEVKLYKRLIPLYKPQIAILGFFVGNDIRDNLENVRLNVTQDFCLINERKTYPIYQQIKSLWFLISGIRQLIPYKTSKGENMLDLELIKKVPDNQEKILQAWNITEASFRDFISVSKANNITPIILIIPQKKHINKKIFSTLPTYGLKEEDFDVSLPYKKAIQIGEENRAIVINLFDDMKESMDKGDSPYLEADGHFSALGNRISGWKIYSVLAEKHILK